MENRKLNDSAKHRLGEMSAFIFFAFAFFSLRFIGLLFPESRFWGVNHLQFLPDLFTFWYSFGIILVLILLLRGVSTRTNSMLEKTIGTFKHYKYAFWGVLSITCFAVFWLFRMPTNFLGDGYSVISNIGNDLPVVYKWTEVGAIAFVKLIYDLLPTTGLDGARLSYEVVSILSGIVTIFFYIGISCELSKDKLQRVFIVSILLFSGSALFFFGYAENYPLLLASMTAYIFFSLRYLNGRSNLIVPLLLLLLSLFIHLQSIFYAISLLVLIAKKPAIRRIISARTRIVIGGLLLFIVGGGVLFLYKYDTSPSFQIHFLPLWTGRPPLYDYSIFSIKHIADIANELCLLVPIWPVLLFWGYRNIKNSLSSAIGQFFLSLFCGGLLFLLILNPRLGMARDWDIFVLSGLTFSLLLVWFVIYSFHQVRQYVPATIILSALLILPGFVVNLSHQPSINYFTYLLELDRLQSKSGMGVLRDYYLHENNKSKADSINYKMGEYFPSIKLLKNGMECLNNGQVEKAFVISEQVRKLEPFSAEPYALRGSAYMVSGQFDSAKSDLVLALQLEPYNSGNFYNLGQLYLYQNKYKEAVAYLRKGQLLDPHSLQISQGLGTFFYLTQQYDSGLVYFEKAIQANSMQPEDYLMAGYCALYIRNKSKTKKYLNAYLKMTNDSPYRATVEEILKKIQ